MSQTLAAKLARLKPVPILDADILAALAGQGDLPDDVTHLARELAFEADTVISLRERLALVPPAGVAEGCVLL